MNILLQSLWLKGLTNVLHQIPTVPLSWKSVVYKSASVTAKSHWLILKVALSTLITDGTVQWVIHQQKLHHTLPGDK